MAERDAAIVVIGNEILSGKVQDTNSFFLAQELRQLGVCVRRITVVPDELDAIAEVVSDCHRRFDVVFTSGGVGPTHDDVTIEGVARALGRRVVRDPGMESQLRGYFQERINPPRLKMADVPEGTELIFRDGLGFPTVKVANVYVLPGIPEILRQKFAALREDFAAEPYFLKVVYTREGEGIVADYLNSTLVEFPDLILGSYPNVGSPDYVVKVTLESKDREYVERAFRRLLSLLPEGCVVRTEG